MLNVSNFEFLEIKVSSVALIKTKNIHVSGERRDTDERNDKKKVLRDLKEKEKDEEKRRREMADLKSYQSLMKTEKMSTNYDNDNDSDDFM